MARQALQNPIATLIAMTFLIPATAHAAQYHTNVVGHATVDARASLELARCKDTPRIIPLTEVVKSIGKAAAREEAEASLAKLCPYTPISYKHTVFELHSDPRSVDIPCTRRGADGSLKTVQVRARLETYKVSHVLDGRCVDESKESVTVDPHPWVPAIETDEENVEQTQYRNWYKYNKYSLEGICPLGSCGVFDTTVIIYDRTGTSAGWHQETGAEVYARSGKRLRAPAPYIHAWASSETPVVPDVVTCAAGSNAIDGACVDHLTSSPIFTRDEAEQACYDRFGGTLCTESQVREAYDEGLHMCVYSWTGDSAPAGALMTLSNQSDDWGCGPTRAVSTHYTSPSERGSGACCSSPDTPAPRCPEGAIEVNGTCVKALPGGYRFTRDEAQEACAAYTGGELCEVAEVQAAFDASHLHHCAYSWVANVGADGKTYTALPNEGPSGAGCEANGVNVIPFSPSTKRSAICCSEPL